MIERVLVCLSGALVTGRPFDDSGHLGRQRTKGLEVGAARRRTGRSARFSKGSPSA